MSKQRIHKNKADYGIKDYYKFYKQKYNKENKNYTKIIGEFNKELIELILNSDLVYQLPFLGMEIMIRKEKRNIVIKDGKVYNPNPIDFKATKDLWDKSPEAKEKRLKIRYTNYHTSGYVFRVYLKKFKSRIKNRSFYKIKVNREFARGINKRIHDPNKEAFDAFLLY